MAGKRIGQRDNPPEDKKKKKKRDKEGVTAVPLHAHDPVGRHVHPMTSAVRLASSN